MFLNNIFFVIFDSKLTVHYTRHKRLEKFLYIAICIRDWWWVHEVYGAIFRGLISHTATQLAAFIFHACGSVTPGSPLMWQAEAQTRMRQRERRLRDSKRWNSLQWKGGLRFFLLCRFRGGMRGRDEGVQKDRCEFAGSCANQWSHHLTDLWEFALRAGWWWVGRKEAGPRERDRVMVGGWERAWRWRELIETSAPLQ